jgi:type VI secretion system lysozyme-like protein
LTGENSGAPMITLSALKKSIKDNLEHLFNTHQITYEAPDEGAYLFAYGVPDLTNFNVKSDKAKDELCRALQRAARAFETRLSDIKIRPGAEDTQARTLHLRVSAHLRVSPARERITFDTILQLHNGKYELRLHTDKGETQEG